VVYFGFFVVHVVATLVLDLQALYPPTLVPGFMSQVHKSYVQDTGDPLIKAVLGLYGREAKLNASWFETFIYCEMFFQLPVFFIGLYALWHNRRSLYIILALYGVHSATTILPCLTHLYRAPTCVDHLDVGACLSPSQRFTLLSSYGVFLVITVVMTVELGYRCTKWVEKGLRNDHKFE